MDCEFNRPMAHQPEVLNIKSKEDIWKNELGLDDAEMASSTSSEDEENHPPVTTRKLTTTVWSKEREEMMRQMREERKELLKQKREMKELEHQQQKKLKIAKKAYSENIAEKNMIIKELEEHIADKDEVIESLRNPRDVSRSPLTKAQGSLKKIINNISRLQDEKQKLLTKYENAMDEIVRMKNDAQLKEEIESKQYATIYNTRQVMRSSSLVQEVAKLKQRVAELEQSQQQMQEASVQTDIEKELEKKVSDLSGELETVKKERNVYLTQLKESQDKAKSLNEKVSQFEQLLAQSDTESKENIQNLKYQLELHVQKIEEMTILVDKLECLKGELLKEQERLKLQYKNLQAEMEIKEEELKRIEYKMVSIEKERSDLSSTVSSLTSSLGTVTKEMNAKLSSLQDQGQASMCAYEAENNSLRSTNATLTAELSNCKRDTAVAREGMDRVMKEIENVTAELTSARSKEKELLVQIQELQDECKTLRVVEKKKSSMESHMISLQQQLDTYKVMLDEKQQKNEQLQNKLAKTERSCRDALAQKDMEFARTCKANQEALELTRQQSKTEAMIAVRRLSSTQSSLSSSQKTIFTLRRDVNGIVSALGEMNRLFQQEISSVKRKVTRAITDVSVSNKNLVQKYHCEMALRKKLHNQVVELKGNIRVLCRVRPPIAEDGSGPNSRIVVAPDADDDSLIKMLWKGQTKSIEVDKVFGKLSTQEQVFDEVRSLVTSCMDGYNICIFAYGQTGSGKTYTMEGPDSNPGINKRAMRELFHIATDRQDDWQYNLTISMTEIYNEQVHDLLGSNPEARMDIKQGSQGNFVQGLTWMPVHNISEINEVFAVGHKNRATAATTMNIESSRSHALLCIKVTGKNLTTGARTLGKLNLIDLAGSERVSKSQAQGERLKEAQCINKSLSALGDVIHSLRSKGPHVPYRNSKLTYLLQDSLSGDSKTLMVVQVAPVEKNVGETMCSLMFAERVRAVELGKAAARKETAEIATLKEKLKEYENIVKGYKM